MNNFLAITGSKESIDQLTDSILKVGIQNFIFNTQSEIKDLSDGCSFVKNHHVVAAGSLITFDRRKENEIHIHISIIGPGNSVTIGVAMGIASTYPNIRVEHRFFKKNSPYVGGYSIENMKLDNFFCWQTKNEICSAITRFITSTALDEQCPKTKGAPYISFLYRDQRAGICHDYFEDNYLVSFDDAGKFYLRVSREDSSGEMLSNNQSTGNALVIGDVIWSPSEASVIEGMLHEFIEKAPSKFYQKHVSLGFSHDLYTQVKNSLTWRS